jgi:tetratricopeptide (TPR) repeat protein
MAMYLSQWLSRRRGARGNVGTVGFVAWSMRSAAAIPTLVAWICGVAALAAQERPSLATVLNTYLEGRHDDALRQAAEWKELGPLRLRFVQDVPRWTQSDAAGAELRRRAAAAFLLELTYTRLETDWGRLHDLIELTCVDLRANAVSPSFELAWYRASIALAGRARARPWLLGEFATLPHQPARRRAPTEEPDPNPRHLVHALERFADDPELKLAQIAAWTWGRDQEPTRNATAPSAAVLARRTAPQREAMIAFGALADDPVVGPEAVLRIGQLHLSTGEAAAALIHFERAAAGAADDHVRYAALFSAGRALDRMTRPQEAMTRYAAALEVFPRAESAAVALATLQFVQGERGKAIARLNEMDSTLAAADPGRLIGYGSYMHWPELQAALRREAIK